MNLRPSSVTVSTHTSAFTAVAFHSPATPNARMSLCTQWVHSFSFPPRPLRTAPSRFPNTIRFGSCPQLIRMSVPTHKSLLVRNVVSMLSHPVISRAWLYEVIRLSGFLRCAPMIRSKTRWCTVRSLAYVVFLAEGPRTASTQESLDYLGLLYHSGLEGERDFRCESTTARTPSTTRFEIPKQVQDFTMKQGQNVYSTRYCNRWEHSSRRV